MMKTIQQHFIEADVDYLISRYINKYPIEIRSLENIDLNITAKDLYESYVSNLKSLILHIQTCKIKKTEDTWIFFAYHVIGDDDIDFALVKKSDLFEPSTIINTYSYIFSPLEETSGFLVASTYLTQFNLEDLLVDYLFESSFFGYAQEHLEETRDRLEKKNPR